MKKLVFSTLMLPFCLLAGCVSAPAARRPYCPEPRPFHRERQVTTTETETVSPVREGRESHEPPPAVENIEVKPTPGFTPEPPTIPPAKAGPKL